MEVCVCVCEFTLVCVFVCAGVSMSRVLSIIVKASVLPHRQALMTKYADDVTRLNVKLVMNS